MAKIKSKRNTLLDLNYDVLKKMIEDLSIEVIEVFQETLEALKTLDSEIALKILRHDEEIDGLQEELIEEATMMIIRQQPVAKDLRRILMVMRLTTEYERVADYTKNIAEYIVLIKEKDSIEHYEKNVDKLVTMIECVIQMLECVMEGLKERNKAKIKEVIRMDEKIDELYQEVLASLITHIQVVDGKVFGTAYAILINKYIERAGDHIITIAEEILYAERGYRYN